MLDPVQASVPKQLTGDPNGASLEVLGWREFEAIRAVPNRRSHSAPLAPLVVTSDVITVELVQAETVGLARAPSS